MMGPVTVTVTTSAGATSYAWGTAGSTQPVLVLDYQKTGNVTIASVVTTSGAGLVYNVEWSNDAPTVISSVTGSSQMTWFTSGTSAISTNAYINMTWLPRCIRVNATTTTSNHTIATTIIQSQA